MLALKRLQCFDVDRGESRLAVIICPAGPHAFCLAAVNDDRDEVISVTSTPAIEGWWEIGP